MIFLQLFYTFFVIGLFTIGGGYAMLPLIQRQVVTDHGWITDQVFTDIVAISQMTPGPIGINSATYIGYSVVHEAGYGQLLSVCGSFAATFAVVLPSFIIVLLLCHVYARFNHSAVFTGFMGILRPAVAGLIGAAALLMVSPENFTDWISWVICGLAFVAAMWTELNPIIILAVAGLAGYFIYA